MRCFKRGQRVVLALLLAGAAGLVRAEIKVSLVAPPAGAGVVVAAASASAPASGSLLVAVEGLDPVARPAEAEPGFLSAPADLPQAAGVPLAIRFDPTPRALLSSGTQRSWVLPFTVSDMPAGVDQTRYLGFKLGGVDKTLAYRLTSPAATPATWSLKPVPVAERAITPDDGVPIGITIIGPQGVRGLRLGPVELVEQGTKHTLAAGRLALCATKSPCAAQAFERGGNDLHTLWLMPIADAKGKVADPLQPGKYSGSVTIASNDKPGGEAVSLTLYVSSIWWRLLGVGLIFIGVVLAWLATVVLRYRLNRNQMLLPVLVWAETATQLRSQLVALALAPGMRGVAQRLDRIDAALTDVLLERHGLPPAVPVPGSTTVSSTTLEGFRKYLDEVGSWVTAVQLIIEGGLQPLQSQRASLAAKGKDYLDTLDGALVSLDKLGFSATLPVADSVAQTVAQIVGQFASDIEKLDAAANGRGMLESTGAALAALPRRASPDQLRLQIAAQSFAAWGFILATTLAAGSYMLVFKNPGFGTPLDLLEALLWGLGLPAGAQLAAATTTPATIASTFSVQR